MDPALAHGHSLLAVLISRSDPRDQGVLLGTARWDGSALWLEGGDLAEAVLIIGVEAKTLLVRATSELRAVFTEGTEYSAERVRSRGTLTSLRSCRSREFPQARCRYQALSVRPLCPVGLRSDAAA
jgi:hypothetical protein